MSFNRRKFLRLSTASAAFLGLPLRDQYTSNKVERALDKLLETPKPMGKSVMGLAAAPIPVVKVGFIGLGMRGPNHLSHVMAMGENRAKVTAICDVRQEKVDEVLEKFKDKSYKPATYGGSLTAWKDMLKRDDIDLVIISTPWEDHIPMALEAMRAGIHVAVEVPAAVTGQECWDMVNTAEEMQVNCMMMENVCYGNEELWVLNMVENGVFGTLTYGEAAYIHDLRWLMFDKDKGYYNQWRIRHHINSDGNLYPTHGLGPVSQYMGIQRGDRFDRIVSMSCLEAGLTAYGKKVEKDNEFYGVSGYKHGDMNNTLVKTDKGRTILIQHDVVTPRPYNRINALAGTMGYHEGYPSRLALEEKGAHHWLKDEDYKMMRDKYNHPIWANLKEEIEKNGGHGGMDFVQIYRLIDCLNQGKMLDMDVYDAAAWSSITPLSKLSAELGSIGLDMPDYTRGKWKEERALGIMKDFS